MNEKLKSFLKKKYPKTYKTTKLFYSYAYFKVRKIQNILKHLFKTTKNEDIVEKMLIDFPMIYSKMVTKNQIRIILTNLKEVLDKNIEGDIVELGCNIGTTSLFIRKFLNEYKSERKFHVIRFF